MIVGDITELSVVTVLDRGVPNKESIAIKVLERINLGQYGIMLGAYAESGMASPYRDNLFWFGDGFVEQGDWIFVETGEGEPRRSKDVEQRNIYTVFWNRSTTLFARTNVVPILFRVDAVVVLQPPSDVPQATKLEYWKAQT